MFLSTANPIITESSTLLDRLGLGAQTLLIGMVTVFLMLFVIFLAMTVMQRFFTRKKKKPAAPVAEAPAPIPAPTESEVAASDDKAVIAAITAAISAYTGEAPSSFRVVSFKKRI